MKIRVAVARIMNYFEENGIELVASGCGGCHNPLPEETQNILIQALDSRRSHKPTPWLEELNEEDEDGY